MWREIFLTESQLVVVTHFLGWGVFLFVGLVWVFWKRRSNSILVSTEVLSMRRLPEPAGLCKGQLFPSRGGDTAPAGSPWGLPRRCQHGLSAQPHPSAHVGEKSSAKNAYCFRKEVTPSLLNAGKLRPHHWWEKTPPLRNEREIPPEPYCQHC